MIKVEDIGKRCLLKFGEDYISGIIKGILVGDRVEIEYTESFQHGDTKLSRIRHNVFLQDEIEKIL